MRRAPVPRCGSASSPTEARARGGRRRCCAGWAALLTLNALALEAIRGVPAGARLPVAMYAISPRVPEFGEILMAARRGVRGQMLLDAKIGRGLAVALQDVAGIEVRVSRRRMYQKYLCRPETGMVLTGTANTTEDATTRHSDHRILWCDALAPSAAFAGDFRTIWDGVAPMAVLAAAA